MVLRSIAILLVGTALGAGVQYELGAQYGTSGSVEANRMASISNVQHEPTQTIESASPGAGGDNAHIDRIRRAHATLGYRTGRDHPPTF